MGRDNRAHILCLDVLFVQKSSCIGGGEGIGSEDEPRRVWYESRMRTLSHRDEGLLVSYVDHKLYDGLEHFRQKARTIATC